jgi:drug/metabolite transporter (DMT)-like permease
LLQPGIRHFHYTGIHKIGTSRAVTLRNSYPFLTVIAGIVFLGEPLTLLGMAGTLLVVSGIVLTSWRMDRNVPSFRWVYLFYPIATVLLTTIVHPLRRYALLQSAFAAFYASPACEDKLVWDRRAFWPLAISGTFETLAVLFMLVAFASGPVYIVSPISATAPIWTLLIGAIFLRELEQISAATVLGTILVVAGVVIISQVQ